jgi:succinyl-diaminopimelate desuccinylase
VSEAVTGERTFARSATGGGDAKALRNDGLSTVEFALGTETAHAVDERTTRQAICQTAQISAHLPAEFDSSSTEA